MAQPLERDLQPDCIHCGPRFHVRVHLVERLPGPATHFVGVGTRFAVELTDEDMIEFVLDESVAHVDSVGERVTAGERAVKAHFFFQPPMRRLDGLFAGLRMAAACVRPESP
jgi:hypothetical protein